MLHKTSEKINYDLMNITLLESALCPKLGDLLDWFLAWKRKKTVETIHQYLLAQLICWYNVAFSKFAILNFYPNTGKTGT